MKVLLDANVFLSYILAPSPHRTIALVVNTCLTAEIDLLLPPELIAELAETAATKRYFRTRISHAQIQRFIEALKRLAEMLPPLEEIAAYSRDPKDDYLITYGVVNEADCLITGDADLLVLHKVGTLKIVTPADFVAILKEEGLV